LNGCFDYIQTNYKCEKECEKEECNSLSQTVAETATHVEEVGGYFCPDDLYDGLNFACIEQD
jgi:hypothetical protein